MSSMSSSSSLKGIEGNPLHFTKRAENYPQYEVKALRAALKESEQRLLALEAKFNKFNSFSHEPGEDDKRKKPARKEFDYCKRTDKSAQGHDESVCLKKQIDEIDENLQAIKERRAKRRAGKAASAAAGDDNHSCVSTRLSPIARHPVAFSATAALDQRSVRHGTVDTAAQLHVCGQRGARGKGTRILLKGITGDTVDAERADVVFPVTTTEGKRYAIFMQNQALVVDKETETMLRVAVLLKAGFDVKFVTRTKKVPTSGGYLVTPDGQKIRMTFGDNLWRLPMWSDPARKRSSGPHRKQDLSIRADCSRSRSLGTALSS